MNTVKNITNLHFGETAIISEFSDGYVACKLMAMGLLPGVGIILIRKSPFGGAYYIKARNHYLALRSNEAKSVLVTNV